MSTKDQSNNINNTPPANLHKNNEENSAKPEIQFTNPQALTTPELEDETTVPLGYDRDPFTLPKSSESKLGKIWDKLKRPATTIPFLMLILLITKILGFIKIRVIAGLFGASREADIFWAAFTIPDTFFNLIVAGSINAAIIPIFSEFLYKRGEKDLKNLMLQLNLAISFLIIILSLIVFIWADPISEFLLTAGSVGQILEISSAIEVDQAKLLAELMRIMLVSPILLGVSSIVTAYLQVYKKFIITTLSPLLYNIGIIFGSLLFVNNFGMGIHGAAWAVIIGSLLHLLTQLPDFIRIAKPKLSEFVYLGAEYRRDLIRVVKLSFPRTLAMLGEQVLVVFNTIIGLGLTAGALTSYKYAFSLHLFPAQIITGSISTVSLPHFAELYAKKKIEEFKKEFNRVIQNSVFLILPFVVLVIVLRMPIVRLAIGVGNWDWQNTILAAWCLALLSFNMLAQSVNSVTIRAFFAVHETKYPLITTALTVIVGIVGTYFFTNFFSHYLDWRPIAGQIATQLSNGEFFQVLASFGADIVRWFTTRNTFDYAVGGIALGISVAYIFGMVLNLRLINKKIHVVTWQDTVKPLLLKLFISFVMLIVSYLVFRWADSIFDTTRTISVLGVLFVTSLAGGIVYLGLSWLFKVKELNTMFEKIKALIRLR